MAKAFTSRGSHRVTVHTAHLTTATIIATAIAACVGQIGRYRELSTLLRIQQTRENRRTVHVGPAHEINGPVAGDQRRGIEVADDPVLADAAAGHGIERIACGTGAGLMHGEEMP